MNASREGRLSAVSAWQLEFARLIAFPAEPPLFLDQHWLQELASGQLEDFVSTRKKHTREGCDRANPENQAAAVS
jgi:hypothetical protein